MKRFQFSLASIFTLTVIAGVLLAFADRLASEAFLQTIWLTTLLLSYGNFPQRGWSKILRVTVITGAVWTVGIFGTHLMYVNVPGPRNLVWRAAMVAAIGTVAAFLAAWLLYGIIAVVHRWLTATVRARLLSAVLLVAVTGSGWTIWNAARSGYWEPIVLSSADLPSLEADVVQRMSYRHQSESSRIFSPDGSVMAKLQSGKLLVYEGTEWAFGRGAREPLWLPGHFLGYIGDGYQLVLGQETSRIVWQVFPRSPVVEPPFWNHLQPDRHHRVSVFDCPTNRVVKQSRWWRSSNGKPSFDESQVLLPTRHAVLIWETSQVAEVGRQP